jgi:acetolactate synthase-1/3 small subunit
MLNENEKSLITLITQNVPGVLAKVCGYCGQNNINIEKLVSSNFKSDNLQQKVIMYVVGDRSRVNLLVDGFLQIPEVVTAANFQANSYMERELMLIKINTNDALLPKVMDLVSEYDGKTILVDMKITIFQFALEEEKNDELTKRLENINAKIEILRTGVVATSLSEIVV